MDHPGDSEHRSQNKKRLRITLILSVTYMVAEFVGGIMTNSLALLADAGHMLADAGALGLSLFALWAAQKPVTSTHTYGYYRTEILAALVNGSTLVAIAIYIFIEAYQRLAMIPEVQGVLMLGIAGGGLLINLASLCILNAGKSESLNIRGAWLHVFTDMLGSIGVMVAAALIWKLGWHWVDPLVSVLIGLLVLYSSWKLLKEVVAVLMEGSPGHIDVDDVRNAILEINGVDAVHDLHVWTITSGIIALSVHVTAKGKHSQKRLLTTIQNTLRKRFRIAHGTIQIEPKDYNECEISV
jgi:cobalt-zinc-cadmium efflux system protein